MKMHLGTEASILAVDPAARTPRAAFFTFVPSDEDASPASGTASPPEFGMQDDFSIEGHRSARIRAASGMASLMFEKRFSGGGRYEYSMLVQGEAGTDICIFYEVCRADGGRESRTVANLTLTDKRLFQVTTHFPADDLEEGDGFQVGVSVQHGEAYFDNFSLTPDQPENATAPDKD